jgi:hypothetical protein
MKKSIKKVSKKPQLISKKPSKTPVKVVKVSTLPVHAQVPAVVPAVVPVRASAVPLTEAQKIWNEIKSVPIQMFGLPNQVVEMHAQPATIEPSKLYLTIKASSTLPALETALAGHFNVELADRFLIVSRVSAPLVPKK